jgi:tetratricopeptide (TPR) repeat protein
MLLKEGKKQLAVKVLSNIAELELENHELRRVLARRLQQIGEVEYAIDIFRDVLAVRPEEPHSYRDLGLALAENGQTQEAVDMMYQILMKDWDGRFPGIETVVLGEMNAMIQNSPNVKTDKIDKRLLVNLPVDIRVVLNWDADNTDMDLWVTEPSGEKCFYGHRSTRSGGYISQDYTRGYGPEEYLLKKAVKGMYKIQLNYYGNSRSDSKRAVTLQVQVFTKFGSPDQKKKEFTLSLTDNRQVIDVGELIYEIKN